jgi:prepilin-type N-terminal cleavage/methylation domain-containing protein
MKNLLSKRKAFTLVELLVALMVTSIVLAAVATLAFAVGSANKSGQDTDRQQAQLRFATIQIKDLLQYSRLILSLDSTGLYCWRSDDDGDCQIDIEEVVRVEIDTAASNLQIVTFSPPTWPIIVPLDIASFKNGSAGQALKDNCNQKYVTLIGNCTNARFLKYDYEDVPNVKFISIVFDINADGRIETYQINAALRCWAGYQLDENENLNSSDDDAEIYQ